MRGGGALPELKNTIYTFIFDGRKRCTSCPKEGEGGGEVFRAMPEIKHSFFQEVFPYGAYTEDDSGENNFRQMTQASEEEQQPARRP